MANISHRLGKSTASSAIRERMSAQPELLDALERCHEYLQANGVDLNDSKAVLGPWVTWELQSADQFVGDFADAANQLAQGRVIESRSKFPGLCNRKLATLAASR